MDWPDEDGAEGQGCSDRHASCHYYHHVMIEPGTGRTTGCVSETAESTEQVEFVSFLLQLGLLEKRRKNKHLMAIRFHCLPPEGAQVQLTVCEP